MFPLNPLHDGHVVDAMHSGVMFVKEEHHGAEDGEYRKYPSRPGRLQGAASTLNLKCAESQQDHGKRLMLQIFKIMCEAIPPTLGTKRPEFRVAEHQEEEAAKQKTDRPCEAGRRPKLAQLSFPKKEETSKNDEESCQMMIKFTLFLIPGADGLLHLVNLCLVVHCHGHIHPFMPRVHRICRLRLR